MTPFANFVGTCRQGVLTKVTRISCNIRFLNCHVSSRFTIATTRPVQAPTFGFHALNVCSECCLNAFVHFDSLRLRYLSLRSRYVDGLVGHQGAATDAKACDKKYVSAWSFTEDLNTIFKDKPIPREKGFFRNAFGEGKGPCKDEVCQIPSSIV